MNTFKKQGKSTGTAHSSDGEAANINTIPISTNDDKTELEINSNDSSLTIDDRKRNVIDIFNNSNVSPQQTTRLSQQLNESTYFDPFISTENNNLEELETLLKSTSQKPVTNNETITASSQISTANDELSDLKSLIMDFSQTLLNKMNIIETKIDDHCNQTRKINHMLTNTILPSLMDLTDIIQETSPSNLDVRVRTKLENIQTRIRTTQQQTEMKDLMDI
jgi:hypothetical protein